MTKHNLSTNKYGANELAPYFYFIPNKINDLASILEKTLKTAIAF